MIKMENSYDEKIMNYSGNSYSEFMAMFEANEVEEMRKYLERNYGYCYEWMEVNELTESVVIDYIKEWLIVNIRDMTLCGTEQLFKLVYGLM